jgi:hypothetical protein
LQRKLVIEPKQHEKRISSRFYFLIQFCGTLSIMKTSLFFAAIAATSVIAQAPVSPPKAGSTTPPVASTGKCQKSADLKSIPDPLKMFDPKDAMFPCDMGSSVPLGPIPKGCAALEIIVGQACPLRYTS